MPVALELHGVLVTEALKAALGELIRRHESLRTCFRDSAGTPVQVVAERVPLPFDRIDLSGFPREDAGHRMRESIAAEAVRSFDLSRAPLLRTLLIRVGPGEHVLALTLHHIISDGWSFGVLMRELGDLYESFLAGRPSPLPDPPVQYADFAQWQREWLRGEILAKQVSFWRGTLAGLEPLELPTDRRRLAQRSGRGARWQFMIPAGVTEGLRKLSQRAGATLFMTMLSAFQVLLSRYSQQDDIAVGTPIANRAYARIEGVIGLFVNTLVLRGDLAGNPAFTDLLRRTREHTLDAYAHQDLPFERLVEELQPDRSLSRTPLFQVMFVLQNATREAWRLTGLDVARMPTVTETAKFDLTMTVTEVGSELRIGLRYDTDLFDAGTIERLAGHFGTLLAAIVADPQARVGELELLSARERRQVLVEWNQPAAGHPDLACLPELVERQAARTPERTAVACGDDLLTYRRLNERANQLARHLRSRGVGPDVVVAICAEHGTDLVVGLLGILKAGGAYLPLDPGYPAERLAFMLADTAAATVVTQRSLRDRIPVAKLAAICLDADADGLAGQPTANPIQAAHPAGLACVIYTSGSSGIPKGVMIDHQGIVNHLMWAVNTYQLTADDITLGLSSVSFDPSIRSIFAPLCVGATAVVLPDDTRKDVSSMLAEISRRRVTVISSSVPSLWAQILPGGTGNARLLSSLRLTAVGSESFRIMPARGREPLGQIFNQYGPTECTIASTCRAAAADLGPGPDNVGRPIAHTQVYVLDRFCQPTPVGVPGEAYIAGPPLARGYLNRPDLTAERFVACPFGPPGRRMYRTGDMMRWLPDGNLEFLGRADDQVKLRGFRVETGEVAAVLASHPAVARAVAVVRDDGKGLRRLVAYVARGDGADSAGLDVAGLRAFSARRLPDYMVPAAVVEMAALPVTASGKLDLAALPPPDFGALTSARGPVTAVEEILCGLFAEALGLERIGAQDSFFDVGGDSLIATRLVSRIQAVLGAEVGIRALFEEPTVAGIARLLGGLDDRVGETRQDRQASPPEFPGSLP
jgi:amino acid adenylation domain-containing protein